MVEVQKTAKLKGFRPGQAPISVIKHYYGEDVRHRLFHNLIDESFQVAVRKEKLQAIGRPKIETPDHKTGAGDHDHGILENQDLTFTAEVEVLPEIEVKGYTGIALERESADITDKDVQLVVNNMRESQAEMIPATGGLANADGTMSSRPVKMGDHADITFDGGLINDGKLERQDGMKGSRMIEVGSNSLIPGFEEQLVGMRASETKTFRLPFPADYFEKNLAGKESEFTVTVNELKEKKLPILDDEFAKQLGYENVTDLHAKANEFLAKERNQEVDRKIRANLMSALIEKNPFDVPKALVENQTRALANEWAEELKRQGIDQNTIQGAVMNEIENLKKRAEGQVRGSLILDAVAKKESIEVQDADINSELETMSKSMNMEMGRLKDFYAKNSDRKEDLLFRMRQERTLKFLLDKSKIKSKS